MSDLSMYEIRVAQGRRLAPPGPARRRAVLTAAVITMAAIMGARVAIDAPPDLGLTFLLALPVGAIAWELGLGAGLAAAVAAMGLIAVWPQVSDAEVGLSAYLTRATIYVFTALVAAKRGQERAQAAAARRSVGGDRPPPPRLTPREIEVLRLIATGHTNREAAERLVVSVRTVEAHRARLQAKTDCSGRAELYRFAVEHDLLEPDAEVVTG